jgi:hypothetical protein
VLFALGIILGEIRGGEKYLDRLEALVGRHLKPKKPGRKSILRISPN